MARIAGKLSYITRRTANAWRYATVTTHRCREALLKRLFLDICFERKIDYDALLMDPMCVRTDDGCHDVATSLTYKDIQRTCMLDVVENFLCAPMIAVLVMKRIVTGDTGLDDLFSPKRELE